MPRLSTLLKYLAAFISGALVLSGILFVYMLLGAIGFVWTPYTCLTDVLGQASSPAGHYFEVSQTSCSGIGKGPAEISVFASKSKRGKKALIFKYERMHDGSRDAEPVITAVDDRTIRISVKHVAMIICRTRRWETLAVEYDIGRVIDSYVDPPGECAQD
ncbi:MAG: hypothetical protein GEV13_15585 [Rhodospirillales bacterium]|nr:hypothetical protein [Rhodospirillales bacterium]